MMSDEMKALLPCPFCGGDPRCFLSKQDGLFYVRCMICGAETGPKFINSPDKQEATVRAAWNTRAAIEATTVKGDGLVGWQPIETAPKDGRYIIARYRSLDGYAAHFDGRAFVVRHEGKTPSEYDLGWALFPGFGGVPDKCLSEWQPLDGPEAADTITTLKGEIERLTASCGMAQREATANADALAQANAELNELRQALGSTDNVG